MTIVRFLPPHHKHCDELFASAEAAAEAGRWEEAHSACCEFSAEIEAHFCTEEQLLFPAFEAASGMTTGPTQMMRFEHEQMRSLLAAFGSGIATRNADAVSGAAETLLVLMQQHNLKEENILYPMCDRVLAGQDVPIEQDLRRRVEAACRR